MNRRRVVHFDVLLAEDDDEPYCGQQGFNVEVTLDWNEVTCKKCLRLRKKR